MTLALIQLAGILVLLAGLYWWSSRFAAQQEAYAAVLYKLFKSVTRDVRNSHRQGEELQADARSTYEDTNRLRAELQVAIENPRVQRLMRRMEDEDLAANRGD